MNVVVAGGTGLHGRAITKALPDAGHTVVVASRSQPARDPIDARASWVRADVTDPSTLPAVLAGQTELVEVYIITESVFSMDGDSPNLEQLGQLSQKYNCFLVLDEAHALGVFGDSGEGLIQYHGLQDTIFARIVTFGKGLGCHGAAILGSAELKSYLVNFARSFIYTTGLSPHSVATIVVAY